MATQARTQQDEQLAAIERAAKLATQHRDSVMQRALRWFAARERGDGKTVAAIEREDARFAGRLRAFEAELALPSNPMERARTYRRVHDALMVMRLSDILGEALDDDCPLCALEACESH